MLSIILIQNIFLEKLVSENWFRTLFHSVFIIFQKLFQNCFNFLSPDAVVDISKWKNEDYIHIIFIYMEPLPNTTH